jgi:hypothetical protein
MTAEIRTFYRVLRRHTKEAGGKNSVIAPCTMSPGPFHLLFLILFSITTLSAMPVNESTEVQPIRRAVCQPNQSWCYQNAIQYCSNGQ